MTKFVIAYPVIFIVPYLFEIRDSHPFQNNPSNFSLRGRLVRVGFKEVIWLSP